MTENFIEGEDGQINTSSSYTTHSNRENKQTNRYYVLSKFVQRLARADHPVERKVSIIHNENTPEDRMDPLEQQLEMHYVTTDFKLGESVCQCDHYLVENQLYPKLQAAYHQFHSTETALLRVHNDILRALDGKKEVILVQLDLSAAFDTIDHDILIRRLQLQYGFTSTVIQWFESYLRGRSQRVVIGSSVSTSQPVTSGVPQGSVLGPLLFILYLAPLEDVITSHGLDFMMYADDSDLYIAVNPCGRQSAISNLEHCISDVLTFFSDNKLVCNPTKTEVIHLYSRFSNLTPIPGINISHHLVPTSETVCSLGATIDKHLTMSKHINKICGSASLAIRNIGRVRKYLDQHSTERLVHAFVTSRLDYCNSLLYGLPAKEISKLQRLQNSAARLVTRSKIREHITPILQELHWLPVKYRITFKLLLITFKILNNCAPGYLTILLESYNPSRTLRSASQNQLVVPRSSTTTYGDRAFSIAAPKLWNSLPVNLRETISIHFFKSKVKTHLFQEAFL